MSHNISNEVLSWLYSLVQLTGVLLKYRRNTGLELIQPKVTFVPFNSPLLFSFPGCVESSDQILLLQKVVNLELLAQM